MNKKMDKAALKELAIKTVSDAIDKGEDVSVIIQDGMFKELTGLAKFFANKVVAGIGIGVVIVSVAVGVNEMFGIIRLWGKTPLTIIRKLVSRDKP